MENQLVLPKTKWTREERALLPVHLHSDASTSNEPHKMLNGCTVSHKT